MINSMKHFMNIIGTIFDEGISIETERKIVKT